jgi:hypothetical protein
MTMENKVHYHDKWLILLGVPLIHFLNYYLTYPTLNFDGHFFIIYSIDTAQGYAAWFACRAIISMLDRYFHWEKGMLKRMAMQVPAICLTMLVVTKGLAIALLLLTDDKTFPTTFNNFNIYIFLIWGFFLNVLYLSLYLFNKLNAPLEKSSYGHKIWVRNGNLLRAIELDTCLCFYMQDDVLCVLSTAGKDTITSYSLDAVEKLSDSFRFFRVNRTFLVSRDLIKSVRRDVTGKLFVVLCSHPDLPDVVIVSRLRESALDQWLNTLAIRS